MKVPQTILEDDTPRFKLRRRWVFLFLLVLAGVVVSLTCFRVRPHSPAQVIERNPRTGSALPGPKFPLQAPPRPAGSHDSFRRVLAEMCGRLDVAELNRVLMVNVVTSRYPAGGGQHVRQVVIGAPKEAEIGEFEDALGEYDLSAEDRSRLESQLRKRYFAYEYDYRLVEENTPIDGIGERMPSEITITVEHAILISESLENFEEKEEAGERYLTAGGSSSGFSDQPGHPDHSDPALPYSSIFQAMPAE